MALGGMAQSTFLAIVRGDASQAVTEFNKLGRAVEKSTVGAGKDVSKFKTVTSGAFAQIKANAGLMAAGAGAAIAGFAVKAVNDFSRLGVAVGQFADATGFSAESASRLIEVAGDINIAAGTVEGAINKMNKAIGASPEEFEKLGIEILYASNGAIDMQATFLNAVDAINSIRDPFNKAEAATALFGRGWTGIAELIAQGSTKITDSMNAVDDAKVFTDEEVAKARDYRDATKELVDVFEEFAQTAGSKLAPALVSVAQALIVIMEAIAALDENDPIKSFTDGITGFFTSVPSTVINFGEFLAKQWHKATTSTEDLNKELDKTDKVLTKVDKASNSYRGSADEVADATERAAEAAEEAEEAYGDYVDKLAEAEQQTKDLIQANKDLITSQLDLIGAAKDLEKAEDDQYQAIRDHNEVVKEYGDKSEEASDSARDLAAGMFALAQEQSELANGTLDSKDAVDDMIISLELMQQNVEPGSALWLAIESYILLLESIPTNIPTTVSFMSTGYTGKRGVDQGGMPDAPTTPARRTGRGVDVGGATGGIVTRPTLSWIGESGPEAVVPLSGTPGSSPLSAFGGGVTNVVINVRALPTDTELIDLVNKIRRRGGQV